MMLKARQCCCRREKGNQQRPADTEGCQLLQLFPCVELHIPRAACIAGRREEDACWFRDGLIVVVSIQGVSQQPVITVFFLSSLIFINAAMIVFHCFFFLIRSFFLGAFLVIFTLLGVKTRDDYFFWFSFGLFFLYFSFFFIF